MDDIVGSTSKRRILAGTNREKNQEVKQYSAQLFDQEKQPSKCCSARQVTFTIAYITSGVGSSDCQRKIQGPTTVAIYSTDCLAPYCATSVATEREFVEKKAENLAKTRTQECRSPFKVG